MKSEKLKLTFLILGSFLFESGFYWLIRTIIGFFSSVNILPTIIFLIFTFLNHLVVLPTVSSKLLTNPKKVFIPFLLFNIVINSVAVIGSFTYLYFVLVNPNYMSLCILFDSFGATQIGNIVFYVVLVLLTFAKPFVLKLSINIIYK